MVLVRSGKVTIRDRVDRDDPQEARGRVALRRADQLVRPPVVRDVRLASRRGRVGPGVLGTVPVIHGRLIAVVPSAGGMSAHRAGRHRTIRPSLTR